VIAVVDYGMGNLRSVAKALEHVGANVEVTSDIDRIAAADGVVLPGVGAFGRCMENLAAAGLEEVVRHAAESDRPFLGICVGMQILFEESEEFGPVAGLGILKGRVRRFGGGSSVRDAATTDGSATASETSATATDGSVVATERSVAATTERSVAATSERNIGAVEDRAVLKVPHMGWNQLHVHKRAPHLAGIDDGEDVYFVHSYYVDCGADLAATTTPYGGEFVSSVWRRNLFAVQFHPEKSQRTGLRLLENFARLTAARPS
jgi:glutamine amidotransferase